MAQAVATKAAKGSNHLEQKEYSQSKESDQPGREENSQSKDFSGGVSRHSSCWTKGLGTDEARAKHD